MEEIEKSIIIYIKFESNVIIKSQVTLREINKFSYHYSRFKLFLLMNGNLPYIASLKFK